MDAIRFDQWIRTLRAGGSSRRPLSKLMAVGTLGALLAPFGWAEETASNQRTPRCKGTNAARPEVQCKRNNGARCKWRGGARCRGEGCTCPPGAPDLPTEVLPSWPALCRGRPVRNRERHLPRRGRSVRHQRHQRL